jgi:hypothetical protein
MTSHDSVELKRALLSCQNTRPYGFTFMSTEQYWLQPMNIEQHWLQSEQPLGTKRKVEEVSIDKANRS